MGFGNLFRSSSSAGSSGLLPGKHAHDHSKKTLVLDLDETLIHSEFDRRTGRGCDYKVPIKVDGEKGVAYVRKRPYVDEFLRWAGRNFEVVVFTASLPEYADPVINELDRKGVIRARLYRHHCTTRNGENIKDLSRIGRNPEDVILVDNAPVSYSYQKRNGIHISSWYDDPDDEELLYLMDILEDFLRVDDVRKHTKGYGRKGQKDSDARRAYKKEKARIRSGHTRSTEGSLARYMDDYSESDDDDGYYSYDDTY